MEYDHSDREYYLEKVHRYQNPFDVLSGLSNINDREIMSVAVSKYGQSLQFASRDIQADKEVVLLAVQEGGCALVYASKELRADKKVVSIAVANSSEALKFASPEIQELCKDKDPVKALQASILADELQAEMKPKPKIDNKPKMKI